MATVLSYALSTIVVELTDGSLINVEMQKIGYEFPIERTFCYGADLLVRQYDRIRYALQKRFQYHAMRPVYIIVLMEESPKLFAQCRDCYIHHSTFQLDSGVPIKNLLNFIYISLDIFKEMPHNEINQLEAWLYFLASDNPVHIQQIIEKYPFFKDVYQDIIDFRYNPKELITMFSESLRIADQNTVKLMIDDLKQELHDLEPKSQSLNTKNNSLLAENNSLTAENNSLTAENNSLTAENNSLIQDNLKKDAEIARLTALLEQRK